MTFRVRPTLRTRAEQVAAERGTTVSRLARDALEQLLRRGGKTRSKRGDPSLP